MGQLRRTIFVQRVPRATIVEDRAAVDAALTSSPYDERALQHAVWNFVTRRAGTVAPAAILAQLGALCDDAEIRSLAARRARRRDVMSWCIGQCFGHLERGGLDG